MDLGQVLGIVFAIFGVFCMLGSIDSRLGRIADALERLSQPPKEDHHD